MSRLFFIISSIIMIYSTLSRQEDLESSFALCKVLGMTSMPIFAFCILFFIMSYLRNDEIPFPPILKLLGLTFQTVLAIGIIMTTDKIRSYSTTKISLFLNIAFQSLKAVYIFLTRRIFCRSNENQIHVVVE